MVVVSGNCFTLWCWKVFQIVGVKKKKVSVWMIPCYIAFAKLVMGLPFCSFKLPARKPITLVAWLVIWVSLWLFCCCCCLLWPHWRSWQTKPSVIELEYRKYSSIRVVRIKSIPGVGHRGRSICLYLRLRSNNKTGSTQ